MCNDTGVKKKSRKKNIYYIPDSIMEKVSKRDKELTRPHEMELIQIDSSKFKEEEPLKAISSVLVEGISQFMTLKNFRPSLDYKEKVLREKFKERLEMIYGREEFKNTSFKDIINKEEHDFTMAIRCYRTENKGYFLYVKSDFTIKFNKSVITDLKVYSGIKNGRELAEFMKEILTDYDYEDLIFNLEKDLKL